MQELFAYLFKFSQCGRTSAFILSIKCSFTYSLRTKKIYKSFNSQSLKYYRCYCRLFSLLHCTRIFFILLLSVVTVIPNVKPQRFQIGYCLYIFLISLLRYFVISLTKHGKNTYFFFHISSNHLHRNDINMYSTQ